MKEQRQFDEPDIQTYTPGRDDDEGYVPKGSDVAAEPYTVLIVDDNANIRVNIRQSISRSYKTAEAENGVKGYEAALEVMPDLIICDVMMPEMDGFRCV